MKITSVGAKVKPRSSSPPINNQYNNNYKIYNNTAMKKYDNCKLNTKWR